MRLQDDLAHHAIDWRDARRSGRERAILSAQSALFSIFECHEIALNGLATGARPNALAKALLDLGRARRRQSAASDAVTDLLRPDPKADFAPDHPVYAALRAHRYEWVKYKTCLDALATETRSLRRPRSASPLRQSVA